MKTKKLRYLLIAIPLLLLGILTAVFASNEDLFQGSLQKIVPIHNFNVKQKINLNKDSLKPIPPLVVNLPQRNRKLTRILGVPVTSSAAHTAQVSREDFQNVLFGENNSVKTFFEQNSNRTIQIQGTVLDAALQTNHPEIGLDARTGTANYTQLLNDLDQQIDLRDYDMYMFILLQDGECTGSASSIGLTPFDSEEGRVTIGYAALSAQCVNNYSNINTNPTLIHEFGHLFGLRHTATWIPSAGCGENIPLNIADAADRLCINSYGGGTPMGTSRNDLNAPQREKLNSPYQIAKRIITNNGDFWISWWRNKQPNDYEELRVAMPDGYYSVELRKNIVMDIDNGITVNFIPQNNQYYTNALQNIFIPDTMLVAPSAYPLTMQNPVFIDQLRHVTITLLSLEQDRAHINVTFN